MHFPYLTLFKASMMASQPTAPNLASPEIPPYEWLMNMNHWFPLRPTIKPFFLRRGVGRSVD